MLRIAAGLAAGTIASILLGLALWGLRPDLAAAMNGAMFWAKASYAIALAASAVILLVQVARPDTERLRWLWLIALPLLAFAGLSGSELAHAHRAHWPALWLGHSWKQCPWLILLLAIPLGVALLWSFKPLAPVRLKIAGATLGFAAGAASAALYCVLYCSETSAIFIITWYSLGILLATLIGALLGPRLLRW